MEVTASYFQRHPECTVHGDTASIRRLCHEDMAHHVNQLVLALEIGDAGPFVGYIDWLRDVLEHRKLSIAHAVESLRLMRDWIEREIEHSNVNDATALLDYAVTLLEAPSSPNRSGTGLVPVRTSTALVKSREVYTEALLTGRRETAVEQVLRAMAGGATLVDVSVDLVQPSMYQVGALWQQNRISVAQEHLASAITQGALAAGFGKAEFAPPNGRSAAFACVQDNHHAIGLRMVSDAFEVAGWDVSFLGSNTPTPSIVSFVAENRPEVLGLSVGLAHHVITLREVIGRVRAELGNAAPQIVIGGLPLNALRGSVLRLGADECFSDAREAVRASG